MIIVTKAGKASVISSKRIFFTASNIKLPTITNTPAVAIPGTNKKNGAKNKATMNNPLTTAAVKPERPPSAIPAVLSA